jgi:hypothetical protein
MSTDSGSEGDESLVSVADRHRRLQNAVVGLDAVVDADTVCAGPRTDTRDPQFQTELVLDSDHDVVPPTVLEAIATQGLGVRSADPQGRGPDAQLVVRVRSE